MIIGESKRYIRGKDKSVRLEVMIEDLYIVIHIACYWSLGKKDR